MSRNRSIRRARERELARRYKRNSQKVRRRCNDLEAQGISGGRVILSFDFEKGPNGTTPLDIIDPSTGEADLDRSLAHAVDVHVRYE